MAPDSASLLSQQAMGGIRGGKGYRFQDAYIVSKLPEWIREAGFCQLLKEGSGDVDLLFRTDSGEYRTYLQVKDHPVGLTEFRDVLKEFEQKSQATPNTYKKFVLASTGLVGDAQQFRTALDRYRNLGNFFDGHSDQVMKDTLLDLEKLATELGILPYLEFILAYVELETDLPGLIRIHQLSQLFCGSMLELPKYQDHIGRVFHPIFLALYPQIVDAAGKAITKEELERTIDETIENFCVQVQEYGFTVRMYHWEDDAFDKNLAYDAVIDWSEHFNRATRRTPSPDTWKNILLPALLQLQKDVRLTGPARLIKFVGSSSLSAGMAFGWAFPEVAQYVIEFQQGLGPKSETWRTDVEITGSYKLQYHEVEVNQGATDLLVKFNMSADVGLDLERSANLGDIFRSSITLYPQEGIGERLTNESAIAYARDAKRLLREMTSKYKTERVHIFFAGPLGLAIFFGQLLNAMPDIHCYEYTGNNGYSASCILPKS